MAYFAELDSNNVITRIIIIEDKHLKDIFGKEDDDIGIGYCKKYFNSLSKWKRVYHNPRTTDIGGVGSIYDEQLGIFVLPQPFPSWSLNRESKKWDPPIPEPELTEEEKLKKMNYRWNEETKEWKLFESDSSS